MSQADAARLRGVTRQSIHRLVNKGKLRTCQVAGRTLLLREDVATYAPAKGGRPRTGQGTP